ncbi:hypothetical protein JZ751_002641 [Albula glossodonta]|uniref:Uncharacterized protein n=1 Tax=Albula glossodonta TaxID=121402 RepID=A0A8T2N8M1_9TELE|nr:hypothetical protein JZ751_002641 [Albula glossodonta]
MELEEKGKAYEELQKHSSESDQKHSKDLENTKAQITLLQGQVTELESRLKQETNRAERAEQSHSEALSQYESACNLVKSKDSVLELKEDEIIHLRDTLAQTAAHQEKQINELTEEKCNLIKDYEESLLKRNEEAEQAKLDFEKSQQEVPILLDQVVALESTLRRQKSFSVELQSKYDELSKVKDDLQEKILEAEKRRESILQEMSVLADQAKSAVSLQEQCNQLSAEAMDNKKTLQSVTEALNQKGHELQALETSVEELKIKLNESTIKASDLEKEILNLKEKLNILEKETEEVSTNNQSLQETHKMLCEEKEVLLKENAVLLTTISEREAVVLMSETLKKELELSTNACAELKSSLENLQEKYISALELNSNLKDRLDDKASLGNKHECLPVKQQIAADPEQLSGDHVDPLSVEEELHLKSVELEELSHAFEEAVRTLEEQMEAQRQASKTEIEDLKLLLENAQNNLDLLQQQHAFEVKNWQQKLVGLRLEMDDKLGKERHHSVVLYSKLEAARLQTQGLDISSQSICFDNEFLLQVFTSEIASKKNLCSEMEDKMHKMEKEKATSVEQLNATLREKRQLSVHIVELEEEVGSLKLQLQTSKCQLTDVMEMLEALEIAKGSWDDKFFQLESELKRVRSEKANLEKHILSMEADFDVMQEQKQKLETELDASKKVAANFEELLSVATTERQQLKQELLSCTEDKQNMDQSLSEWKGKAEQLEKNRREARELIKILEEDVLRGKKESDIAHTNLDGLRKEKEQLLQQFQILEQTIGLLNGDKEGLMKEMSQFKEEQCTVLRNSENMESKIQILEEEKSKLSQTLESSLVEKGEIASRLNSTQEEVTQMRAGIEKLKVRIEADERKKRHMRELLKAAQRKADCLQDNIEKLEREKEMTEQNLEDAVIQAEAAKAEVEDLDTEKAELTKRIEQMTTELNNLQVEKQKLEKELVEKNEQSEQLQKSALSASANLERVEMEVGEAERKQKDAIEELRSQMSVLDSQLQACQTELESAHLKKQDLASQLSSYDTENTTLSLRLQEAEKLNTDLRMVNSSLKEECEVKEDQMKKCKENTEKLQQQVAELQTIRQVAEEKLLHFEGGKKELEMEKMQLQSVATEFEQTTQAQSAEIKDMKATIANLESNVKQLEETLEATKMMNAELAEKMNTLQDANLRLQSDIVEARRHVEEKHVTFEQERLSLTSELQSLQQQAENYKSSLEVMVSEKEELKKNLSCMQENLTQEMQVEETTHKEMLNKVQQQVDELHSRVTSLSKEKDAALSKMNLWMTSCKKLEKEKQALLEENEQQGTLITTLKNSQKQELKEALEDKSREADEGVDKYCSLMVSMHKLEETNESLKNKIAQLTRGRKSMTKISPNTPAPESKPDELERKEDGQTQASGKRQWAGMPEVDNATFKTQEALHQISKRIRAGMATPSAEDEEFRPEGLPELVQRGFADIPLGEMSPFIMRRTTVQRCSPRIAARRSGSKSADASCFSPKTPAEGSKQQKELASARGVVSAQVRLILQTGGEGLGAVRQIGLPLVQNQEATSLRTPIGTVSGVLTTVGNSPKSKAFESPKSNMEGRKGRRSLSHKKTPEQREKHRQLITPAKQDENCQVVIMCALKKFIRLKRSKFLAQLIIIKDQMTIVLPKL